MKLPLLVAVVFSLVPVAVAQGQEGTVTETIRLRYLDPKSVINNTKAAETLDQLTCDFKDNSVTARGSRAAVSAFKTNLLQADVEPTVYTVKCRLVRYQVSKKGKVTEATVFQPMLTSMDHNPAKISQSGGSGNYAISITPAHDSVPPLTLTAEVQELGEQGETLRSGKNTRHMALGEKVRITGMTDATDNAVRRAAQQGEVVTNKGAYSGYYLEAEATVQNQKPSSQK